MPRRFSGAIQDLASRLTGHYLFWVLFVLIVFGFPLVNALLKPGLPPLGLYGHVPPFVLEDEAGEPFSPEDLRGKIWILQFFDPNCGEDCPLVSDAMIRVRHRVRNMLDTVHLVTISIAPIMGSDGGPGDHPASSNHDPLKWTFLTGPPRDIDDLLREGFLPLIGKFEGGIATSHGIPHPDLLILVDPGGQIRGYYRTGEEDLDRLMVDITILANAS